MTTTRTRSASRPAARARSRPPTDSGHGANANIFTSLVATYTDNGSGAAGALTGHDDVGPPAQAQAGRVLRLDGPRRRAAPAGGDPGVQKETTTDAGGGQNIGFIENGDYVSFEPSTSRTSPGIRFRVASGGAGGTIEVRLDSPTGPLVGTVAVAPTGGWQNWANVTMACRRPPAGHARAVPRVPHPTRRRAGCSTSTTSPRSARARRTAPPPEVTATPSRRRRRAARRSSSTARRPIRTPAPATADLPVGLRRRRHDRRHVDRSRPDLHVRAAGHVHGALHGHRPEGASRDRDRPGRGHERSAECPQNNVQSDEFEGDALDTNRWTVIRPDSTRPPTVSGGNLNFPIDNGSLYGPARRRGTSSSSRCPTARSRSRRRSRPTR